VASALAGLRGNLNDGITRDDAIEMLAQHLISRPVFDALFEGYSFAEHNPVAQTMEKMLATLDEHQLDDENASLDKFYESVRVRAAGIDNAAARQRLLVELYDSFFATAFTKTVDKLGIVYTPVEIVDFIIRSADWALRKVFGKGLTDEGVHVLDGFAGTGTFITRLLTSGLIDSQDLARKYKGELHANEILLLAYYIAAVNIETTYQDLAREHLGEDEYVEFPGLVLADTFQMHEHGDSDDLGVFADNNERVQAQRALDIRVIIGNPPYSAGQDDANDNNQNESYPDLDDSIRTTYSLDRGRGGNNSVYNSYIRAIRWATLRVKESGVIAYVINGGFIDANAMDGLRRTLAGEFSHIYIYNLRGNGRVAGEARRKEGRPLFEFGGWNRDGSEIKIAKGGSKATIAIVMLIRNSAASGVAQIHYAEVDDYLTAGQKISRVASVASMAHLDTTTIVPNSAGDWINQRTPGFEKFLPLGAKHGGDVGSAVVFATYTRGLETGRDAWVYNSSEDTLLRAVRHTAAAFNQQVTDFKAQIAKKASSKPKDLVNEFIDTDRTRISWTLSLKSRLVGLRPLKVDPTHVVRATYRPFFKQYVYFDSDLNHIRGRTQHIFPKASLDNIDFYYVGTGSAVPFSVIMLNTLPDLHVTGAGSGGQFFPRWTWEKVDDGALFATSADLIQDGYRRVDNISDEALARLQAVYGPSFTKDDLFYYVYALLHSPDYRMTFAPDLKRMLPRIPLVAHEQLLIDAGRRLAELHLGYESLSPFPLDGLKGGPSVDDATAYAHFAVTKMAFGKPTADQKRAGLKKDLSAIVYNSHITLRGIPEEAYEYMLGSRSAIEWIMDRYQVKVDMDSGIKNNPNDWSLEVGDPRYIIDLLGRIVTVSLETVTIVNALPRLEILPDQGARP
jgi:predicted helicase